MCTNICALHKYYCIFAASLQRKSNKLQIRRKGKTGKNIKKYLKLTILIKKIMEQNDFKKLKEWIEEKRDSNDVGTTSKICGLSTPLYYAAMRKSTFDELTEGEFRFIEELCRVIKERIAGQNKRIEMLNEEVFASENKCV